jgi:peptidoglycan/LPS O-acetylase OafA/YrhL
VWLREHFEISRGGEGHNLRVMEGLRGLAVFLVFLVHYVGAIDSWSDPTSVWSSFVHGVRIIGDTGVDLFFVLSGYLIYGSIISRQQSFLKFIRRRVQRIYPAFTVVFLLYLILSFVVDSENKIPPSPLSGAVYVAQNFLLLPGLLPITPMISVAWSLSYEMFYYLALPLVVATLQLRKWPAKWRLGLFILMAAAIIIGCSLVGGPVRLSMFVAGILVYELMAQDKNRSPSDAVTAVMTVCGLFAILLPLNSGLKMAILFGTFFLLCLTCFSRPRGVLSRIFMVTPMRWLGNMSYSYYLLHGLAIKVAALVLVAMLPGRGYGILFMLAMMVVLFVVSLVPTTVLFLLVERPFSLASPKRESLPQR